MEKVLGNVKRGMLFVLSAPAGTGKTTLVNRLVGEFPCVIRSISYTTRARRGQEKEGVDYHFVSEEQFDEMKKKEIFLESAKIYENHYGTSKDWVEKRLNEGKHVVLVIDVQGAKEVRKKSDAVLIFVKPPSLKELALRLEKRKTETEDVMRERLEWAKHELEESQKYDYCVINDDFETAYQVLRSLLIAEEHKLTRSNHGT